MKQLNSDLGVTREDLRHVNVLCSLLNSVHGANLEDLPDQPDRHDREELECPCSAPILLNNPVQGENLEDFQERQPSAAGPERPTARILSLPPTVPPPSVKVL